MRTGAQTAKRRKAGSRITTAGTFLGGGQALNADEDEKKTGTGFRKKAVRCVSQARSLSRMAPTLGLASVLVRSERGPQKNACSH